MEIKEKKEEEKKESVNKKALNDQMRVFIMRHGKPCEAVIQET